MERFAPFDRTPVFFPYGAAIKLAICLVFSSNNLGCHSEFILPVVKQLLWLLVQSISLTLFTVE